jgi:dTDP-4-amino-4,6-dideoxygalactose transaminase
LEYFYKIKKKYDLILIEDAAQSINLEYKSRFIGNFGDFAAISFHETKNIHCGLGGCLIVNNKKFLKQTNYIWDRGTNRSEISKRKKSYSWHEIGSNYYPSEFQSIILFNQLKKLNSILKIRKKIFLIYKKELKKINNSYFESVIQNKSNYHSIYLLCKNEKIRFELKKYLLEKKIESTSHYEPLHLSKFAIQNKNKIISKSCNNAEHFSKRILRLPMHNYLRSYDIKRITKDLKAF